MHNKIAIFGATGYLGKHLFEHQIKMGRKVFATSNKTSPDLFQFDLTSSNFDNLPLNDIRYAIISIAITSTKKCENNLEETYLCNVKRTLDLCKYLHEIDVTPIVFSSDYVFDGLKGSYLEEDNLSPLNEYGRQKAKVESEIFDITNGNFILIRLSKVYSCSKGDNTFIDEMASKLTRNISIKAAYDQVFCPIHIDDVVSCIDFMMRKNARGIFNLGSPSPVNRYDLAIQLAKILNKDIKLIQAVSLKQLGENFSRPQNTSLCIDKILSYGIKVPRDIETSLVKISKHYS